MTEGQFWAMVEGCRADSAGDFAGLVRLLRERLLVLPPAEILDFSVHWHAAMATAWSWPVWDAACVVLGWVGDDSFGDFRSWLISHGRAAFERVIADPDNLADLAHDLDNADSATAEQLGPIASWEVYEEVTGEDLPEDRLAPGPLDPVGERIDLENDDVVRERFPRLWEVRRARREAGTLR